MVSLDKKFTDRKQLIGLLRKLMRTFKRVAFTGSYDDLEDKPEAMTAAEAEELESDVMKMTIRYLGTYDTEEVDEYGVPVPSSASTQGNDLIADQEATLRDALVFPTFKRTGYTFAGFNKKSNRRGDYVTNGQGITDALLNTEAAIGTYIGTDMMTLYAVYESKNCTVVFDTQGSSTESWSTSPLKWYTGIAAAFSGMKTVTPPEGKQLAGWFTEPNGGGIQVTGNTDAKVGQIIGPDDSEPLVLTLYAYWTEVA